MFCRLGSLRAEPAGRGHGLIERRVNAAGLRMDHRRQRIDVGALELGVLPVLDDLRRQRVHAGEVFEHVHVGAGAGLGALEHRQLLLREQNLLKLLGRADVELPAGELVDFAFKLKQPLAVLPAELARAAPRRSACRCIPARPARRSAAFPACIESVIERRLFRASLASERHEPQRHVGVFGGVLRDLRDRHFVHPPLRACPSRSAFRSWWSCS